MDAIGAALVLAVIFLGPLLIITWGDKKKEPNDRMAKHLAELMADVSKLTGRVEALERKATQLERDVR